MEIATALQDRFGESIDWKKSTDAQNKTLRNAVAQEAVRAVDLHPEAKGWYDENIKLTVDVLKELDPDISKPENDFIFKILLAATSDGNKVRPQFLQSWDEYTNWKNTGKISGQFVSGDRVSNIRKNLFKVEAMIQAVGWEKLRDFLTKKGTVSEIREALVKEFGLTKQEAANIGTSELVDEVVPYAIVLGPKLGSFFNNLYGDFSSVTMDRWFMRTMGRLTGTQVDTSAFKKVRSLRATLRESISKLTLSEKQFLKISSDKIKGDNIDAAAKSISTRFAKKETRDRAKQLESEGRPFMEEVRKRSNALKKIQSPLVEAPLNGRHRRWIRQRIAEVQGELKSRGVELENADLQAVLWYLEKELYDKLNYRAKPGDSDYASAAAHLYERVVGQPSSVYAGATGRIRAVGGGGPDVAMGAANPAEAGAAVAGQRYMPAADREVTRAVNINDNSQDFTGQILKGQKTIETRDTLNNAMQGVLGQRIGLTRTGTGDTKVVGYATVAKQPIVYRNESEFRRDQGKHLVEPDSKYDIKKGGVKYGYELTDVTPVEPFAPKSVSRMYSVIEPRYMPSDTDYLSAVKQGDTKTAQQMVDEAAKAAAYGTNVGGFFVKNANESIGKLPTWADEIYKFGKLASENGRFETVKQYNRAASYGDAIEPKRNSVTESALRYWDGSDGTLANYIFEQGLKGEEIGPFVFAERIGNAPERGYSLNYRDQTGEQGVSVLGLLDPSKGLVKQNDGTFELFNDGERRFVGGFLTPFKGSDGEPLLIGIQFDGKRHQIKSADPVTRDDAGNVIPLSQRFKSTSEDIRYMPAGIDESTGLPLNNDGTVTVYHHTNKKSAQSIQSTGVLKSAREPDVYVTTETNPVIGYGSDVVKINVDPARLQIDDEFPDGRKDFRLSVGRPGGSIRVNVIQDPLFMPQPDSAMPGAYSFTGGYRALPGKSKGSLRLYGPAGELIGVAASLDEAQRILRRKNK